MNIGGMFCRKYSDSPYSKRWLLLQLLVTDNNETAPGASAVMCLSQERTFLVDLKNAKRNPERMESQQAIHVVSIHMVKRLHRHEHMHAGIARKLSLKIPRKRPVELDRSNANPD